MNADMTPRQITHYCPLDPAGRRLLRQAIGRLGLSARAYHRIIKVARTIADLGGQEALTEAHLQEAIQYRIFEAQSFGSS